MTDMRQEGDERRAKYGHKAAPRGWGAQDGRQIEVQRLLHLGRMPGLPDADPEAGQRTRRCQAATLLAMLPSLRPRAGSDIRGMQSTPAIQLQRLRRMTADEKVKLSHALWVETWRALAAGVEARHPDWSRDRVRDRVRELIRGASS